MIALEGAFFPGNALTPPDMDIFIVQREANGTWGAPVALGVNINTEGQEGNPYLADDGKTLYYTSTGFPGLGKSDVFMSYLKGIKNTANDWVRAVNLGKEVNDTYAHRGFGAISPDGTRAVVQINEGVTALWMYDFGRGTLTPFGSAAGSSQAPLWTPDGTGASQCAPQALSAAAARSQHAPRSTFSHMRDSTNSTIRRLSSGSVSRSWLLQDGLGGARSSVTARIAYIILQMNAA